MRYQKAIPAANNHTESRINEPLSLLRLGPQGPIQDLLKKVSSAWEHANRDEALRSCFEAVHCASQGSDLTCSALAQTYMAGACARCGHLAEGIDWAKRAVRRFRLLGNKHNTMVAHLLLARLEHSLHSLEAAQMDYQKALSICRKLQSEEKASARRGAALYEQIIEEIQSALAEVSTTVIEGLNPTSNLNSIPILQPSDGPDMATLEGSDTFGYATTTGEVLISGRMYRLYPLSKASESNLEFKASADCFALFIPEDGWLGSDGKAGDYALVRRESEVDREGPGVLWTEDHWIEGRFERDTTTGDVHFVSPQPYVIGKEQGHVIALLKPIA
jgi:tetratricopeptide (TPR) repeat protein